MNINGPEQDRTYWTGWSLVVALLTVTIVIGIIVS